MSVGHVPSVYVLLSEIVLKHHCPPQVKLAMLWELDQKEGEVLHGRVRVGQLKEFRGKQACGPFGQSQPSVPGHHGEGSVHSLQDDLKHAMLGLQSIADNESGKERQGSLQHGFLCHHLLE